MSFTRFYDDPIRIRNQVESSSYAGRYALNTPGQGLQLPFIAGTHALKNSSMILHRPERKMRQYKYIIQKRT